MADGVNQLPTHLLTECSLAYAFYFSVEPNPSPYASYTHAAATTSATFITTTTTTTTTSNTTAGDAGWWLGRRNRQCELLGPFLGVLGLATHVEYDGTDLGRWGGGAVGP